MSSLSKGVYYKPEIICPWGENSVLSILVVPITDRTWCTEMHTWSHRLPPFATMAENPPGVSTQFKKSPLLKLPLGK